MTKIKILILTIISIMQLDANASRIDIGDESIRAPSRLGTLRLYRADTSFFIEREGEECSVAFHSVDPMLRELSDEQLKSFIKENYIQISQFSDGEYKLTGRVRGLGGGPLVAATFGSMYAPAGAAVGAAVGGPVGAVVGAAITGGTMAAIGWFLPSP